MTKSIILLLLTSKIISQTYIPLKDTTINYKGDSSTMIRVFADIYTIAKYQNSWLHGPVKTFYKNGNLRRLENRVYNDIDGFAYNFTPHGDTASIETYKKNKLITSIIFYSNIWDEPFRFYFVSKSGVQLIKNAKPVKLDKHTPDSLIEQVDRCYYMWLKGKRELFRDEIPKYINVKNGKRPGRYRVCCGQMEYIRPLKEEEKNK